MRVKLVQIWLAQKVRALLKLVKLYNKATFIYQIYNYKRNCMNINKIVILIKAKKIVQKITRLLKKNKYFKISMIFSVKTKIWSQIADN